MSNEGPGWTEGGADVSTRWIGLFISALGVVLLLVVSLIAPGVSPANQDGHPGTSGGSVVTPAPYGPPEPDRYRVPDRGLAPSLPLVGSTP